MNRKNFFSVYVHNMDIRAILWTLCGAIKSLRKLEYGKNREFGNSKKNTESGGKNESEKQNKYDCKKV